MSDLPRKPSMMDVGRLAGVSHQTVSRVINRKGYVTEVTRMAVEEAMAQLKFRPNLVARGLALRRTQSIGVINLGMPENASLAQLHVGITSDAAESGFSVTMATVPDNKSPIELQAAVAATVNRFLSQGVDGIIVSSPFSTDLSLVSGLAAEVPVVELTSDSIRGVSSVGTDGEVGGRAVGEHFIHLGHTRIAHVDGPPDRADARDRRRGFEIALAHGGVTPAVRLIGDWTSASGYDAGLTLRERSDITAIFCANDQMALGLVHAFSELDKFAPRDYSVAGFDDIPDAAHFIPPLTTVHQDFVDMGRRAFTELSRLLAGGRPSRIAISPQLVVRSSTAPFLPS